MRALHTAATGMMAQELNVQVISNNIANMRTTGYKRQRAEFQDLLYEHVRRVGTQTSQSGTILPAGSSHLVFRRHSTAGGHESLQRAVARLLARKIHSTDCWVSVPRERLWPNAEIEAWYTQNMLFYVHRNRLADYHRAGRPRRPPRVRRCPLVHPRHYLGLSYSAENHSRLVEAARCGLSRHGSESLKLRAINLLVFPIDWTLPRRCSPLSFAGLRRCLVPPSPAA